MYLFGKTAAFMIPTIERLLYRDTRSLVTRVLVLAPTRELAIQIFEESRKLAQFTDIRIAISTGNYLLISNILMFFTYVCSTVKTITKLFARYHFCYNETHLRDCISCGRVC
jgi:superfamily II DNA or RNA helicase